MNSFQKFLTATFMSAVLLIAGAAQAMTIRQFDKMGDAGGPYLADLVQAAEQSLKVGGPPNRLDGSWMGWPALALLGREVLDWNIAYLQPEGHLGALACRPLRFDFDGSLCTCQIVQVT